MQPQQPNYDFIMNSSQPGPRRPMGGNSMAMRALVFLGGLFVLAIIAAIVVKFIAGANANFSKPAMLAVAQDQTELIRLSTIGSQESVSQTNKNFSATTQLGMVTEQQQLLTYLAEHGYKLKTKQLGLKQNAQATTQLAAAEDSSTFDAAYTTVMTQQLDTYKADLNKAYKGANGDAKSQLTERYKIANLLTTQLTGQVADSGTGN